MKLSYNDNPKIRKLYNGFDILISYMELWNVKKQTLS